MFKTIEMIEVEGKNYEVIEFDEIDQEKYCGFNYVTVNKINGKKYTGKKIWGPDAESYLGSGKRFKNAINKYGRENFIRYIIDLAESEEELDEKEIFYINEEFNAVIRNDWYNIGPGGEGGDNYSGRTEEENKKSSKKMSKLKKKPIVIFKNRKYLNEFESITSAAEYLEQIIGGTAQNLGNGLSGILNHNWVPKRSRFKGYCAMYLPDYEKLKEDPEKLSEYLLKRTYIEEEEIEKERKKNLEKRKRKTVVVFKNVEKVGIFSSITKATHSLEKITGVSFGTMIWQMIKGWTPKSGRLKGYHAMYLPDYEKLKEDPEKLDGYFKKFIDNPKDIVILKNDEYLDKFSSRKDAIHSLEKTIGGNLGTGIGKMINDNWTPKKGQLKGYRAMYFEDYEKLPKDLLKRREYFLELTRVEEEKKLKKRRKRRIEDIVILKNGEKLNTLSSKTYVVKYLESKIGGNLADGVSRMVNDSWEPKSGQLKGYSAMYLSDYEKQQEDQLQKIS